jgi:hypothetical protein
MDGLSSPLRAALILAIFTLSSQAQAQDNGALGAIFK